MLEFAATWGILSFVGNLIVLPMIYPKDGVRVVWQSVLAGVITFGVALLFKLIVK